MLYKNNIGPHVRRKRYSLGWSQSTLATKLQIAGLDISRSGVSKIEARLRYVDDKSIMFPAEVLNTGPGTLFTTRREQTSLRLHGATRNDAILIKSSAPTTPT
jgi:transcriptional regulator with XRE-family HTH domain